MKLVLICGPYGSGSTAVAGLLSAIGAVGFGLYHRTNDPRTRSSYELVPFRDLLMDLIDETTMSLKPGAPVEARLIDFRKALSKVLPQGETRPIFLKHAASALIIPQICQVFETRLVYMLRAMKDIEATRQRRNWAIGTVAQTRSIYSQMFDHLVNRKTPTAMVRYNDLVQSPLRHAKTLANFAKITCDEATLKKAAGFIVAPQGAAAGP